MNTEHIRTMRQWLESLDIDCALIPVDTEFVINHEAWTITFERYLTDENDRILATHPRETVVHRIKGNTLRLPRLDN